MAVSDIMSESFLNYTQKDTATPWKRRNFVVIGMTDFQSLIQEIKNNPTKFKRVIGKTSPYSIDNERFRCTDLSYNSFPIVIDMGQENGISFKAFD